MNAKSQDVAVWGEARVRELIEPAKRPFLQVVKRDKLPLVWTREAEFATQVMLRDDRFAKIPPDHQHTIVASVKNLAFIGLTLNPARRQATIIARYNRDRKVYEAAPLIMYQGFTALATEAGVHGIKSEVVYKGDTFRHGSDEKRGDWYEYELDPDEERDIKNFRGVFVAARMPAGDLKFEWLTRKDVFRIRDKSESYLDDQGQPRRNSPWVQWFDEMAKKGGIKRAYKRWEEMMADSDRWTRFLRAMTLDNETEGVIAPRPDDIEATPTEPSSPAKESEP